MNVLLTTNASCITRCAHARHRGVFADQNGQLKPLSAPPEARFSLAFTPKMAADIAKKFLLQSPPGELNDVASGANMNTFFTLCKRYRFRHRSMRVMWTPLLDAGIKTLLGSPEVVDGIAPEVYREYNTSRCVLAELPGSKDKASPASYKPYILDRVSSFGVRVLTSLSSGQSADECVASAKAQVLITKVGEVDPGSYLDPRRAQVVTFDHVKQARAAPRYFRRSRAFRRVPDIAIRDCRAPLSLRRDRPAAENLCEVLARLVPSPFPASLRLQAVTGTRPATAEEMAPADAEPLRRARGPFSFPWRSRVRWLSPYGVPTGTPAPPAGPPSRRLSTATSQRRTSRTGRFAAASPRPLGSPHRLSAAGRLRPLRKSPHQPPPASPAVRRLRQEGRRRRCAHSLHLELSVQREELLARAPTGLC